MSLPALNNGDHVEIVVSTGYGTIIGEVADLEADGKWLCLKRPAVGTKWVQVSHIVTIEHTAKR